MASSNSPLHTRPLGVEARRARPALGTLLQIKAGAAHEATLGPALNAALAAVDLVERLMSFHAPDSELTRLNRDAASGPVTVHPWTFLVLAHAQRISRASAGQFDVCVAPRLVSAGLLPTHGGLAMGFKGSWRDVDLLPGRRVAFRRPLLVDLGGIAKGFAVDCAIWRLRRAGCTHGLVNAGGDLRRFGRGEELIELRTRRGPRALARLRCGAVATSAAPRRNGPGSADSLGQIFDPLTGEPWTGLDQVSVAAPSCLVADALTKVAALLGPACLPLLARFGAQARWSEAG